MKCRSRLHPLGLSGQWLQVPPFMQTVVISQQSLSWTASAAQLNRNTRYPSISDNTRVQCSFWYPRYPPFATHCHTNMPEFWGDAQHSLWVQQSLLYFLPSPFFCFSFLQFAASLLLCFVSLLFFFVQSFTLALQFVFLLCLSCVLCATGYGKDRGYFPRKEICRESIHRDLYSNEKGL